jgi:hypothetical protein
MAGREFTQKDIDIFNKLAPESGGSVTSEWGHTYPFILRPISHKFVDSSEDFKQRIDRLTPDELDYLVELALDNKEDIRSLEPEDIEVLMDMISEKISDERAKQLKQHIGIV